MTKKWNLKQKEKEKGRERVLEIEIESFVDQIVDGVESFVDEKLWVQVQRIEYGLTFASFHFLSLEISQLPSLPNSTEAEKGKF